MSGDTSATPTPPQDVSSATLLAALEVTGASYGYYMTYTKLGDEDGSGAFEGVDPAWSNLVSSGWTMITSPDLVNVQTNTDDHYQGVAFYKDFNGVTEIIIGNRGSQPAAPGTAPYQLYDFLHSDASLAVGITPAADTDAVNYYKAVASWATENLSGQINITEVGHSLGGQEADYVEVTEQNSGNEPYTTNAVTFDAPGLPWNTQQSGVTYDALNISMDTDLVHAWGSVENGGYGGTTLEVPGGKSLAPYELGLTVGRVIPGLVGWLIEAASTAGTLYTGLVVNHMVSNLYAYFAEHSSLADVSLLNLNPAQVTPDGMIGTPDYPTTGVNGTGMIESFTETDNSTGEVLQGSDGDSVTVTDVGSGANITDSSGDQDNLTFNGSVIASDTWSTAAGVRGSDNYNPDGSSTSTVYYSTGGYAMVMSDGQGNITTDYYNSSGDLFSWSALHADGTTISGTEFDTGHTLIQGSTSFRVPTTVYQTVVNPDGSYVTYNWDPEDQATTTDYDASGNQVSTNTSAGPGQNYVVATQTTSSDSAGDTETTAVDSAGDIVWESWQNVNGTSGKTTFNASGVVESKNVNADGSAEVTFSELSGITHNYLDSDGNLVSDDWSLDDGTSGQDTFGTDGSGTGTINYSNGLVSTLSIDSSLDITISNENSSGQVVSKDWWHPNGTHGITVYNTDGSSAQYSYTTTGLVVETDYTADGTVTDQQTTNAGATFSPDGSEFGTVQNSDGTTSIDYMNSNGEAVVFNVSASGTLESLIHVSTVESSQFSIPMQTGGFATSGYNGFTPVVTSSDGTTVISYLNGAGQVTADDWSKTDGSHGYDAFNADGSSTAVNYSADGTYYTYADDGVGNTTTEYYDATSTLTNDTWQDADGSHGGDTYNADGSSTGDDYQADGSYVVYSDDGQGNIFEEQYAADGTLTGDTWQNSDGSYGTDTFNADGSKSGVGYDSQGDYETYSEDVSGNKLANYYTASGQLVQRISTLKSTGGASVAYTFDANGNLLSQTVTSANGSTSTESGEISGAESNLTIDSGDGDSLVGAASGGVILAWGNQDTLSSGGGSILIDAGGNDDVVSGGSENDTLEALGSGTTLNGGLGNETFVIGDPTDVVEANASATSNTLFTSVSYTLPTHVDVATAIGNGNVAVQGNSDAANIITGNTGNDTLIAGDGSDTLIAGTGVDTLEGSDFGHDTFVINNSQDVVYPEYGGYYDTIQSSVSYTLTSAVDTLILTGQDDVSATDQYGYASITGNAGNDTLTGGSGSDTLVAGSGADTLVTGSGRNTLVINSVADVIDLSFGAAGKDTLESSVSDTLAAGLDTLILTGQEDLVGQANDDTNVSLTGNTGNDTLIAGTGNDELIAGSGADTLIAGTGNNTLVGSASGVDTYELNAGFGATQIDLTPSDASNYNATIQLGTGISASDLSLSVVNVGGDLELQISDGASVVTLNDGSPDQNGEFNFPNDPNLTFAFANGSHLTLGELWAQTQIQDTTVTGSTGNLVLNADAGAQLAGGSGNDTIIGLGAGDVIEAGTGNQVLAGYGAGDNITGGVGNDTLVGGAASILTAGTGSSTLYGGTGSNTYFLTEGGNTVIQASPQYTGQQWIVLPAGMSLSDFTPILTSSGDLILQSNLSDGTNILITGYAASISTTPWFVRDQQGDDGESVSSWVASAAQGGGSGGSDYEHEVAGLLEEFQVNLQETLQKMGAAGQSVRAPYNPATQPESGDLYTFTGIQTQNETVQGGSISVGPSESYTRAFVQTGSQQITDVITVPVYETVTVPGSTTYVSPAEADQIEQELELNGQTLPQGYQNGYYESTPAQTVTEQTGVTREIETYTLPVGYDLDTQGYTEYNIVGDGGSDNITATAPFVGTVVTGDGNNVNVDLGGELLDFVTFYPYDVIPPGAFIEIGNGVNDSINGTGNADTVTAGLGLDYISVGEGSTVYVPMAGASTDIIQTFNTPEYGDGPFPHNTLVLPEGITPEDLQYKLISVPAVIDDWDFATEAIQLTYGDSTVLTYIYPDSPPSYYVQNFDINSGGGINYFEFSDGTVLTRAQVLQLAGAEVSANFDGSTVSALNQGVVSGTAISASELFGDTDSNVTFYQVTNTASSGGYFTLNGTAYAAGATFDVPVNELSNLQYVPGTAGVTDTLTVSAFNGVVLGSPTTFELSVAAPAGGQTADGPDETVTGSSTGPDTLTGGYSGDVLVGNSGRDTFANATGGGAETISETVPVSSSSANVLQFGTGITASELIGNIDADGSVTLSVGTSGDSVTLEGFNPLNPLSSMPIQQFDFADGSDLTFTQLLSQMQSSGTELSVTNADGTTSLYDFNAAPNALYYDKLNASGQLVQEYILNMDGSTETDSYTYNSDGSYADTQVQTTAGGVATTIVTDIDAQGNETRSLTTNPDGSTDEVTYDSQGRHATEIQTDASGNTTDSTYSYNSDGSLTLTQVDTPAGGGSATTVVDGFDSQGNLLSSLQTDPDGSTHYNTWNSQGQPLSEVDTAADGSSNNTTWAYNADGSYATTDVETPAGGAPATTEVVSYNSSGNELNDNGFTPGSDGSYYDYWSKPDGSNGSYWWNSSTAEYHESWSDVNGTTWTDDYQYASGGSPGSTGVSFTETYSDSNGDQGTRQYDATTGITAVTWDSTATGMITGTVTDSGFIGLQNDGELTNTQPDLTFFNPAASPAFQNFLAGH